MGANCGKSRPIHDPSLGGVEAALRDVPTCSSSSGSRSSPDGAPPLRRSNKRHSSKRQAFITHSQANVGEEYDVGAKAGAGTQGVVFRATRKRTGAMRAVKKVPKKTVSSENFMREIQIMRRMDHPNIIKLFETFEDKNNTYLVMELCGGGELFDKIVQQGSSSEPEAAIVLQQILRAVNYMHENDICHRDLKPENFLFWTKGPIDEDNLVKLIDFGIACECPAGATLKDMCGTPFYMAPQVVTRKYDKAADLWSCGVVMFCLLCGTVPFNGPSDAAVLHKVRDGVVRYSQSAWSRVSSDALHLVKKLLTRSVKDRFTALQALDHDWIKGHAPSAVASLEEDLVQKLRDFRSNNRLKQAALAIVANEIDDDQIRHLRSMFTALDTNGDGLLLYAEIRKAVEEDGLTIPEELDALWRDQKEEPIDYTEFLAATLDKRSHLSDEAIEVAFGMFDLDNNGKITTKDVSRVFEGSTRAKMHNAEGIVQKYSAAGDGTMDLQDFKQMMHNEYSPPTRQHGQQAAPQVPRVSFNTDAATDAGSTPTATDSSSKYTAGDADSRRSDPTP